MTLREAAARFGVSESAIRKRVERGTLRSDKGPDGKRYVYPDEAELVADNVADIGADQSATGEPTALISEMRGRIEDLRDQLEAERQAHSEARRIIAGLVERIPPAIEAPRESPVSEASPGPGDTPTPAPGGPQTATERPQAGQRSRSLLSRIFGR